MPHDRIFTAALFITLTACAPAAPTVITPAPRPPAAEPAPPPVAEPAPDTVTPPARMPPPPAPTGIVAPGTRVIELERSTRADALDRTVRAVIDTPPLHRTHWGVLVYDPRADRALVSINPEKHFVPASNNKLLVSAAALAILGADWRYRTTVEAFGGSPESPDVLWLAGAGDPTMSKRFYDEELTAIETLADRITGAGVRSVNGALIIDASRFDSTLVNGSWEVGDLDWYYAAPVAAVGASEGAIPMRIAPGSVGQPARIETLTPRGLVTVRNRIRTVPADTDDDWSVRRLPGDTLVFTGTLHAGASPDTEWVAVHDPAAYVGRALLLALETRGVRVARGVRVVYDSAAAAALRTELGNRLLGVEIQSPPMRAVVQGVLEPSQNWIAETLLKTLGAEGGEGGSWRGGLTVLERFLVDEVGIDSLALNMRDASGLSAQNLVTPEALVRLLAYARLQPWGVAYVDALAAPGEDDSTLERRLLAYRGRVFAKTGTIANVNSLSGYVITDAGDELVFSVLTNGSGLPASRVRGAIDRIVEAIAKQER